MGILWLAGTFFTVGYCSALNDIRQLHDYIAMAVCSRAGTARKGGVTR